MPIIPATQEVEIGKTTFQCQLVQKVRETPPPQKTSREWGTLIFPVGGEDRKTVI
jgi:hypothetical protein